MILLSIIFLFVVAPVLWAILMAFVEVFAWQSDRGAAKQIFLKFDRYVYEVMPVRARAWRAFKQGYWAAFWLIVYLALLGLLLWLIFGD